MNEKKETSMSYIQKSIQDIEINFPELVDTSMLIKLGIFSSEDQACQLRQRGEAPEYLQLSDGRVLYLKKAVINWLKEGIVESEFNEKKPEKKKIKMKIRKRQGKNRLIKRYNCVFSLKQEKFLDDAAAIICNEIDIIITPSTIIRAIIEERRKSKEIDKDYWLRIVRDEITRYS